MVHDLRRELYGVAYDQIDFAAHRQDVAVTDLFVRPRYILRLASRLLSDQPLARRCAPLMLQAEAVDSLGRGRELAAPPVSFTHKPGSNTASDAFDD